MQSYYIISLISLIVDIVNLNLCIVYIVYTVHSFFFFLNFCWSALCGVLSKYWFLTTSQTHRLTVIYITQTILLNLLDHSFLLKFPVFVSIFHLTLHQCCLIPTSDLLIKSYHHFLLHLLVKSLNRCIPLVINNGTSTLSPSSSYNKFLQLSFLL